MTDYINKICREDFFSFVTIAHRLLNAGKKLGTYPYLLHLCNIAQGVAVGSVRRLVVNLPPRHAKTFVFSICLPAWLLGQDPSLNILIISYSEELSTTISSAIRRILRTSWFRELFPRTKIASAKVDNITTTAGGRVLALPLKGHVTGFGGDTVIIDDPVELRHADDQAYHEDVIDRFERDIASRLDNPAKGRIIVVMHRHHPNDLAGHLLEQGGWHHVELPFLAKRPQSFDLGNRVWQRNEGELLRPDAYPPDELRRIRALPNFQTLYQQDPTDGLGGRIRPTHFGRFSLSGGPSRLPTVMSIDAGQSGGKRSSYSVVQAWSYDGRTHFLIDQWRQQCSIGVLKRNLDGLMKKHQPCHILVEGPALAAEVRPKHRGFVHAITPTESKASRLRRNLDIICSGVISLPEQALWLDEFIEEVVAFPSSAFDDQVDALTQYFDFIRQSPDLWAPLPRSVGSVGSSMPISTACARVTQNRLGCLIRYRRLP